MINLGILEDDLDIVSSYVRYIDSLPNISCVISANSVEEFEIKMKSVDRLDVVLSDIGLPGKSGIEGIRLIKNKFPESNILMFTVYNSPDRIFRSLCAGASGYLLKNTPMKEVATSIEGVHRGDVPMSPTIARKVLKHFNPKSNHMQSPLTSRELEIVQGLVDGLSYKMIAGKLFISFQTVKSHIKNIYAKLHVNSKAEVIAMSYKGEI